MNSLNICPRVSCQLYRHFKESVVFTRVKKEQKQHLKVDNFVAALPVYKQANTGFKQHNSLGYDP